MKSGVIAGIVVILVFGMLFGTISYVTYLNHDKPHVFTPEEIFATECAKRGGNPRTEKGTDSTGDKYVDIKEYKCEGVSDVRN